MAVAPHSRAAVRAAGSLVCRLASRRRAGGRRAEGRRGGSRGRAGRCLGVRRTPDRGACRPLVPQLCPARRTWSRPATGGGGAAPATARALDAEERPAELLARGGDPRQHLWICRQWLVGQHGVVVRQTPREL